MRRIQHSSGKDKSASSKRPAPSPAPAANAIENSDLRKILTDEERWKKIAEAAYRRAEQRGFAPGGELDDWMAAEREIDGQWNAAGMQSKGQPQSHAQQYSRSVDEGLKDSFPASDPPSTHTPDEPPVNAADKWATARRST